MNAGAKLLTAVTIKWALLSLLATGVCGPVRAQVRLGVLGGIHSSNVLEQNSLPGWDTATKPYNGSRPGFQVGIIVEIPLGHHNFFFQPALTYTTKGRIYDKNNDSATALQTDTIYNKQTLNLGYIEVPLNLTYKFPLTANHKNSFFISAGPYFGFFYNGNVVTSSLTSATGSTNNQFNSETDPVNVGKGPNTYTTVDVGINGRAGFELGSVMVSGYFSRGLSSFYNATYPGTFRHELAGVSVGIWLTSAGLANNKPRDTDHDGIPDDEDLCPLQPGTKAWHGCPVPDTDHDGIDDEHDSCKTIPGVARYNGCPVPDTDHDGIDDEHDSCPTVPGLARYNGCPIPDRDHDGVNDEEDQCPDIPGTVENHGCPVVAIPEIRREDTEKVNFIAHNILFKSASDRLTGSSFTALDQLAALLRDHPEWRLSIEGHTDNSGTAAANLLLSKKRAAAVKNYLVSKGIAADRLKATGFGQERPIAGNDTPEGKAANRRVELKLSIRN
jgi:OmpA-OmpF porin, OOP family